MLAFASEAGNQISASQEISPASSENESMNTASSDTGKEEASPSSDSTSTSKEPISEDTDDTAKARKSEQQEPAASVDDDKPASTSKAAADSQSSEGTDDESGQGQPAEISYPKMTLSGKAGDISVRVSAPAGALPEGTKLSVEAANADDLFGYVSSAIGEDPQEVSAAATVSYLYDGVSIAPNKQVTVSLTSKAIKNAEAPAVVAIEDSGTSEISGVNAKTGKVSFKTGNPATYAIASRYIEGELVATDGKHYRVRISYDDDASIPAGSKLSVSEITGKDAKAYKAAAEKELGLDGKETFFDYTAFLDISIIHDGVEIEPASKVNVDVSLLDADADDASSKRAFEDSSAVIHFDDKLKNGKPTGKEIKDISRGEDTDVVSISFEADSFSVFGIGSIAKMLSTIAGNSLSASIYGLSIFDRAEYSETTVSDIESGIQVLEAYKVSGLNPLWINIDKPRDLVLGKLESVKLYSIKNGKLANLLAGNSDLSTGIISIGNADGFALVKDSGLRSLTFSSTPAKGEKVSVDGMLPKDGSVNARPVKAISTGNPDSNAIAAYNVSVKDSSGNVFQPEGSTCTVTINNPEIAQAASDGDIITVSDIASGKMENIDEASIDGSSVSFEATGFGTYQITKTSIAKTITASDGKTYEISVSYGKSSGIPTDGVDLTVSEIDLSKPENSGYAHRGAQALGASDDGIRMSKAFDIAIVSASDSSIEYQPANEVEVSIRLIGEELDNYENVGVVHFESDENADTVSATVSGEKINFPTRGFSPYFIAGYTLSKTLVASDDKTYEIKVICPPDSEIPEGAELEVEEITEDAAAKYNDYVNRSISTFNVASLDYAKFFDITIVDGNDHSKNYQPASPVEVSIEVIGGEIPADASVIHFSAKDELVGAVVDGSKVSFQAESFSVYAIANGLSPYVPEIETASTLAELIGDEAQYGFYISTRATLADSERYATSTIDTNATKQVFKTTSSISTGAVWYLEPVAGTANRYKIYTILDGNIKYITNPSGLYIGLDDTTDLTFDISSSTQNGRFIIKKTGENKWFQYSKSGSGYRFYTDANNAFNTSFLFTYAASLTVPDDVYGFDNATYGLISYSDGLQGEGMMAQAHGTGSLVAEPLMVRTDPTSYNGVLYVSEEADLSMWTFHNVGSDNYTLSTIVNGSERYLCSDGNNLSLGAAGNATVFAMLPGSGSHAGQIQLTTDNGLRYLSYEGTNGFTLNTGDPTAAKFWLNLAEKTPLGPDDFVVYTADKVSVSDTEKVPDGARVIVYTRSWDPVAKKYIFYAINHDGRLIQCYESGDSIQWVGTKINTLLWNFTEYHWEGTNDPNYYYELYNQYSEKYLAPQIQDNQILSDDPIGINLQGRKYGDYYTTIMAWDDPYYSYAGLKVENGQIVSVPVANADDFYFAIVRPQQEEPEETQLNIVPTIDHEQHGITMKIIDFDGNSGQNTFLKNTPNSAPAALLNATQGLLSTQLGTDGYPTNADGVSMASLFAGATQVNHLFTQSTYNASGYYEFDSTQNFATLMNDNTFKVYQQLGTHDESVKPTLQHGQFFPYNDIEPGVYTTKNKMNLYTATAKPLSDTDPRKYEKLHLIKKPNYHFGVELEASFVQTPSGLDAWGHDIIYNFTGDDDFWLYVDGELVIDLGGVHSALPGSINYSTGEVSVNGKATTLYDIFRSNYAQRNNLSEDAPAVTAYLDEIFELNEHGQHVFKDYSSHTMRIFFMERGAGASNLFMKFNLSSVKAGQVTLNKKISGTDRTDYKLAEYPYQIFYQDNEDEGYKQLTQDTHTTSPINVAYYNTSAPVKTAAHFTPAGGTTVYDDVFFLTPGQSAVISFPDETINYYIVECGVNTQVYDEVSVNDGDETVTETATTEPNRKDFSIEPQTVVDRARVVYDNHVNETAKRTLTVTKRLQDIYGNPIIDDPTGFNFRFYFGNENDDELSAANFEEYFVKNSAGEYCRWDVDSQSFVSLHKRDFGQLSATEVGQASFQTSMNGAISKIPAEYKVEFRDLLVGTKFKVEERSSELPAGYSFVEYQREGNSYITHGEEINAGTIRENESPAVSILNKRGIGLTMKKAWSDSEFMDHHGDIYFAVYVNGTLLPGTERVLRHPATSVYYYFDSLEPGTTLADYAIREVKLTGDGITADADGHVSGYDTITALYDDGTLNVEARSKEDGTTSPYVYVVSYSTGQVGGTAGNVRVDTATNSRPGIKLVKTDIAGQPLAGARFTLSANDQPVGSGTYTSGTDGSITIAYAQTDTVYTLSETRTPSGYRGLESDVLFKQLGDGTVQLLSDAGGCASVDNTRSTGVLATISVKNRPSQFSAIKIDSTDNTPLEGVKFALYRQVTVDGITRMDYSPMPGYGELITGNNGKIPSIDQTLPAGTYYLKEVAALENYEELSTPVCFTISATGDVSMVSHDSASLDSQTDITGAVSYVLTIDNALMTPAPTDYGSPARAYNFMFAVGVLFLVLAHPKVTAFLEDVGNKLKRRRAAP